MDHLEGSFGGCGELALYYQCWCPQEESRAVLAVAHGFGEHSSRYGNVVDWFVPRGYAVYAFDLRGHGRSPGPRGYVAGWGEFLEDMRAFLALIRAAEPDRPLFLLGHSVGGVIALEYALRYPEELTGVIASSPTLVQVGISPFLLALGRVLSSILPRLTLDTKLDATTISRDPAVVETYVADPLVHSLGTPRFSTELSRAMAWTQAHAAELAVPLLIVHGGADRLSPPEGSRVFYENVRLAEKERQFYETGYHELFNDLDKEQVLAAVEAWLERQIGCV